MFLHYPSNGFDSQFDYSKSYIVAAIHCIIYADVTDDVFCGYRGGRGREEQSERKQGCKQGPRGKGRGREGEVGVHRGEPPIFFPASRRLCLIV